MRSAARSTPPAADDRAADKRWAGPTLKRWRAVAAVAAAAALFSGHAQSEPGPGGEAMAGATVLDSVPAAVQASVRAEVHAATATAPDADEPLLGVNADLSGLAARDRDRLLSLLADAGVSAVRIPLRWSGVERSPGHLDWRDLDAQLDALAAHGIRPLLTLRDAPAWTRRDPPPPPHIFRCDVPAADVARESAPPTDPAAAGAFAAALAARRPDVWAVEVWHEPNLFPNWRALGPDPEDYAAFLSVVAEALRAARPDVKVVSAGPAPTTDLGPCAMSDVVFLDRVARTGVLHKVDAIGIAPFGLRAEADDPTSDREVLNFARARLLSETVRRHGATAPLWAVAWGWRANTGEPADSTSPWGGFSPEVAGIQLRRGWAIARSDFPWLGPMFVWHLLPTVDPLDPARGFALVDPELRPTALFGALSAIGAGVPAPARSADEPIATADTSADWTGRRIAAVASVLVIAILGLALAIGPRRRRSLLARAERTLLGPATAPVWLAAIAVNALCVRAIGPDPAGVGGGPDPNAAAALVALVGAGVSSAVVVGIGVGIGAFRPALAMAAIFALAPFAHALPLSIGTRRIGPVELLIALSVAGAALRVAPFGSLSEAGARTAGLVQRARAGWAEHRLEIALVAGLVGWSAASLTWAEVRGPAAREWRTVILDPVVVYALLRLRGRAVRSAALGGMLAGAVAAALVGLAGVGATLLGGRGAVWAEGVVRASGPYASPNNLALWLGRAVAAAAALIVVLARRPGADAVTRARIARVSLALVPLSLGLLATFSRGALLFGLGASAVLLVALGGRGRFSRRLAARALAVAAVVVLLMIPFAGAERVREAVAVGPGTTGYIRLHLWAAAVEMGLDQPWRGVGLDNFLPAYRDRYVHREVIEERFLSHPHNAFLDWWTRLGLVGVLLFAGLAGLGLRQASLIVRTAGGGAGEGEGGGGARAGAGAAAGGADSGASRHRLLDGPPSPAPEAAAGLAILVYSLAHGMVDNHFFLVDLALAWWLGLALVMPDAKGGTPLEEVGPPGFEPGTVRL